MVKVQEEGTSPPITSSPIPSPSIPTTTNSISGVRHKRHHHHHHHLQHTPLQHFHHFHHHWTFPEPNAPATFHFGPGFEPQFPRFVAPSPGPSSSGSNGAGSVGTSSPTPGSNGNGEHVVHFHVNPGVTVSFQIGDNTELIRDSGTLGYVPLDNRNAHVSSIIVPQHYRGIDVHDKYVVDDVIDLDHFKLTTPVIESSCPRLYPNYLKTENIRPFTDMVASQGGAQETHNDMYCSAVAVPPPYGGEFYHHDSHYYVPAPGPGGPTGPEMCPAHHTQMCTLHGDFGPVTVPMVSTNSSPPIAMPVQVPPGHVVQQIVDESGTLRHVILSPQPQPQPQPIVPMHNPHNYGAGNGNTQPPQTFYAQGLPPGYPPPHYHSNMPPGHLGHVQSGGHLGHSPPPAHGFHKDERTQRQYNKLKRKLEQKRSDGLNSGQTTPLLSPRKELVNGLRRGAAKERGMNSVGTSEDGEESSSIQDDEDEVNVITDILSSVQTPQVSELSSRSALLQWSVPSRLTSATSNGTPDLEISESELRYDVLLSDKGKEGKYKSIYSGASLSCRIQDLKPGQEYSVCLQVHLDELQGSASDPMTFTTPACEPDQPLPPKLIGRTKTSLQLRWNATTDNGSHILQYILEYDEGKGGGFQELSKGRGKQYHLTKLQPSTVYRFRLAAVNECGKSNYSDVISFSTSGSPPPQPAPPILKDVYIDSLRLVWNRRPTDDEFTLQMDEQTGYGYMNSYVGKETEYLVPNLRRYSDHKFRLRTSNEENVSSWSDEVCFRTLPDRPGQPARPVVKGRIHAHSFKLKWEPPHDKGGADITAYILELSSGSSYETVYTGSETEAVCDKLAPGTTYQLRVSCMSAGGRSNYSDPCTVTTEAICPGKCSNLRLHGKPRATSLNLKWTEPDYNGGAPVTEYELDLVNPELSTSGNRQTVYRGKEPECTVTNLLPGNTYSFMVRALNRVGSGPWSDVLDITSGAASPDTPLPPVTIPKSPFHIYVEWQEPNCNGAALTEYKLEMSNTDQEEQYSSIFQGLSTSHDVKGLVPFTTYFFRVQASNSSGCSLFSQTSATMTPASIPSTMIVPRYEASPVSLTLFWHPPASNGSDILNYVIEIADKVVTTDGPVTEHTIDNLKPETLYKIKIKAVNNIGSGIFSPTLRASTLPLPPPAPKLDCIAVGHNYLKLKWGDGKNADFTQYCLEMEHNRTKEFHCIYHGTNFTYKVNKLQELTTHRFRISASSDAGEGDFSDVYEFKTCIAPPIGMKAPKIVETTQRTCGIEWAPCKISSSDPIEYTVQLSRLKEQDYKVVYRGPDVKMILSDLEPGTDYNVRVCPVRLATSGELQGVYSPSATFQTAALEPLLSAKPAPMASASPARRKNQRFFAWITTAHSDKKPMSDTQWAIVIIAGFTMFAIVAAVVVEQFFINWGKTV